MNASAESQLPALAAPLQPIKTPHGFLRIRSEHASDGPFLFALFDSVKSPQMASMPVDAVIKQQLLHMQFRALTQGYRQAHPAAQFLLILLDGQAIGRLILDCGPGCTDIVYLALLPVWQNRRIGITLMTALLAEPMRRQQVCRACVAIDNPASLQLWKRLGFEERQRDATAIVVEWRAVASNADALPF